ncbi:MAG: hypothetical protein PW792_03405 [Acidobacteriaceae bacterium]|nr:hypothetical protein [Acidobacteriaceae bacterium]
MTLKPRQIILLVIVLALGAWNLYRYRQAKHLTTAAPADASTQSQQLWAAFDNAASLRDAPTEQFSPAFKALQSAEAAVPSPNLKVNADLLADVRGCKTWLEFYRSHKNDPSWQEPLSHHLKGCTEQHHDTTA